MESRGHLKPTDYDKTDVNILLLGETGVGKSTFINSFANYLQYHTLETAINSKPICLIPSKFSVPDEDFVDRVVEIGADDNEDVELGNSSTQGARAYVFRIDEERKVRLIDTPGIGDSRGVGQDEINFENILSYIGQFSYLHAICFLLKPNVAVINAYFKFCIIHLMSRLERSAASNIIFVFTNTRSSFYRPAETLPVLRRILAEIKNAPPHVEIPCGKPNIFCTDNEAFKFLVALKNGVRFGERERREFGTSWEASRDTCWKLLQYVAGTGEQQPLKPHEIHNTLSVNEARRCIVDLSRPLADISDLIQDNLDVLRRHQDVISQENISMSELQKRLYVPVVKLEELGLTQPVTVCSAYKCTEIYTVEGLKKVHYKQRCHNPCYLKNVPAELVGTPELTKCAAMDPTGRCKECGCDFKTHMHIYYETKTVNGKIVDGSVQTQIKRQEDVVVVKRQMIVTLEKERREYEAEKDEITRSMAKFAHFLQENSITAYNDAYSDYLDYLIEREKKAKSKGNVEVIRRYEDLKRRYEHEKQVLEAAFAESKRLGRNVAAVTTIDVFDCIAKLYKLKHTGKNIKKYHEKQQQMKYNAHVLKVEYYHPEVLRRHEQRQVGSEGDLDELCRYLSQEEDDMEQIRLKIENFQFSNSTLTSEEIVNRKMKLWNAIRKYKGAPDKKAESAKSAPKQNSKPSQSNYKPHQKKYPSKPSNFQQGNRNYQSYRHPNSQGQGYSQDPQFWHDPYNTNQYQGYNPYPNYPPNSQYTPYPPPHMQYQDYNPYPNNFPQGDPQTAEQPYHLPTKRNSAAQFKQNNFKTPNKNIDKKQNNLNCDTTDNNSSESTEEDDDGTLNDELLAKMAEYFQKRASGKDKKKSFFMYYKK